MNPNNEQDGAARGRRLAGKPEYHHSRRLRYVLGAAVRHLRAVQPAGVHRDLHLRGVQRWQRNARQQSRQPLPPGLASPPETRWESDGIGQSLSIIDPKARSPRVQQYPSTCSASCRWAWRWRWPMWDRTPRTSRRRRPTSTSTRSIPSLLRGLGAHGDGGQSVLQQRWSGRDPARRTVSPDASCCCPIHFQRD